MYDGDGPSVSSEVTRKARKVHKCGECGRDIHPGERYSYTWGKWEGDISVHKCCAHCEVLRAWLGDVCGGWIFGMVGEDFAEHARDYHRFDLWRLVAGQNRDWQHQRGPRAGQLMPLPRKPRNLNGRDAAALAQGGAALPSPA